jgi:hypothetical protein
MHRLDLRRVRPKSPDERLMLGIVVGAILLGLLVVLVAGHPLDVAP